MPNRIIKESICTSEQIAALKDFEFRLWIGLITQADDAGRGDARPAIIKGRIFPLRECVTSRSIDDGLNALVTHGLVVLYEVDGRPIYWLPSWAKHQRIRDVKPKYPAPPDDVLARHGVSCRNPPQSAADRRTLRPESESESESKSNPKENPRAEDDDLTGQIERHRLADDLIRRYHLPDSDVTREEILADAEAVGFDRLEEALKAASLSNSRQMLSVSYYRAFLNDKKQGGGEAWAKYERF